MHSHEILFLAPGCNEDPKQLEIEILEFWKAACLTVGLETPNKHGISVQDGSYAAEYSTKWGMDSELTKSHIKHGRDQNYTPFDMLEKYGETKGEEFAELFREFARAFKGKRQLVWSDGMRDLLGLGVEKTDEELAAEVREDAVLLGTLTRADWSIVLCADKRGELLIVAAMHGWEGVKRYIRELVCSNNEEVRRSKRTA